MTITQTCLAARKWQPSRRPSPKALNAKWSLTAEALEREAGFADHEGRRAHAKQCRTRAEQYRKLAANL